VQNRQLILAAARRLAPRRIGGDRLVADVAAALLVSTGEVHVGVCLDTASGTGFCAEAAAIASMATAGQFDIEKIVAVWRDPQTQALHVLPPCGRCRLFIQQVSQRGVATQIVLDLERTVPLSELLPETEWPAPLDLAGADAD
jgi:cytidine deaminase